MFQQPVARGMNHEARAVFFTATEREDEHLFEHDKSAQNIKSNNFGVQKIM
jgi:hypothetical protein